jgi:Protein of unknown function (DUF2853)
MHGARSPIGTDKKPERWWLMADSQINYADDVKKYVANVDTGAVNGIVKHLGIALRSKDSSLVAASDPEELKRVRDGFMKKKLALTQSDAELDAALKEVMTKMKGVREKSRVTVCYLLAEKFGKLGLFAPKG